MSEEPSLTPAQCRAGRHILGWGVRELAAHAHVSLVTVVQFENGSNARFRTIRDLRRALEDGGVEFIDVGDDAEASVQELRLSDGTIVRRKSDRAPRPE